MFKKQQQKLHIFLHKRSNKPIGKQIIIIKTKWYTSTFICSKYISFGISPKHLVKDLKKYVQFGYVGFIQIEIPMKDIYSIKM